MHLSENENIFWREAKIKPLATLINCIITRDFEEDISLSSLTSATKGLTPFAVPHLKDSVLESINKYSLAVATATHTTTKDIVATKRKAEAPDTFDGLVLQLKRFGNLLFALFGRDCPLFLHLAQIIETLDNYSDNAKYSMTKQTIATVLWIVHLQARHFAAGKMKGAKAILPVFQHMATQLEASNQVYHGDCPTSLYISNDPIFATLGGGGSGGKRKLDTDSDSGKGGAKRPKIIKIQHYHPKIKAAMTPFIAMKPLPRIQKLCTKAGIQSSELLPNKPQQCIKSTLFGTCFDNCRRKHDQLSDEEAKSILTKLKPVIDNPASIQVNP